MIIDTQNLFSDDQAITTTADSDDYVDFGAPGTPFGQSNALSIDQGKGSPIPILIQVTETFVSGTSLTIALEFDDDSAFGSTTVVWESEAIVTASLVAGYQFLIYVLPPGTTERYAQLRYTVSGTYTAGKITAGVGIERQENF